MVVAIIVTLIGILVVALGTAARRAQAANTQFFLSSIGQALVRFETDMGYLPPVLGRAATGASSGVGLGRDLVPPPNWVVNGAGVPDQASIDALQVWYSVTTLPEYLLGYGDRFADGYGAMGPLPAAPGSAGAVEVPLLGLRSPGPDGVWGALLTPLSTSGGGRFVNRNNTGFPAANANGGNGAALRGKVYGPYLDLKEDLVIAGLTGFDVNGDPILVRPGDAGYSDDLPKVFVDYWGSPIHYYRKAYAFLDLKGPDPEPSLGAGVRPVMRDLGDVFTLRPAEFRPGEEAVGVGDSASDTATLARLKAARWAVLSRGADKNWDRFRRRDVDGFNRDNIVEVGQ